MPHVSIFQAILTAQMRRAVFNSHDCCVESIVMMPVNIVRLSDISRQVGPKGSFNSGDGKT